MNILRKIIYLFFLALIFAAFVFFGGGRAFIRAGEKMEEWEVEMKRQFGKLCKEGEKELRKNTEKVKDAWSKEKNLD
ncbi:hypothetical protein JXL19_09095 [bacterium]|nr:hypothetical protein [bacterium]